MASGQVGVVLVHGANPAYSLPAGAGFQEAFDQVPFKVSFASAMDETAAMADLIMPDRHFLESWGDARPRPGVHTVQQPVMQAVPHFDSKQTGDALLAVASHLGQGLGAATFYEYLRAPHLAMHADDPAAFERMWHEHLRTGMFGMMGGGMGGMMGGGQGGMMGGGMGMNAEPPQLRAPDQALTFDAPTFDGGGDLTLIVHPSPRLKGRISICTSPNWPCPPV